MHSELGNVYNVNAGVRGMGNENLEFISPSSYQINDKTYYDVYIFDVEKGWDFPGLRLKIYFNNKYGILRYEYPNGDFFELQL